MLKQRIFCISPVKRPVARIGRGRRRPDARPGRARKGASPAKPDLKFFTFNACIKGTVKKRKPAPENHAEKSISVIFRMSPLFFKRNRVILKVNE